MDQISLYLEKFKNYGFEEIQIKELVVLSIKEMFGSDIGRKSIKINNGEVIISVTGPLKSEIFIQKKKLIETIKNKIKDNFKGKTEEIRGVR